MEEQELEEHVCCRSCAELVWPGVDPSFVQGEIVLCLSCGAARGGEYDSAHDRWLRDPNVTDLEEHDPVQS